MSEIWWDLSGTDKQCAPGHRVHWIHFNHSMRERVPVIPVTATVDDDGIVLLEGDDLSCSAGASRAAALDRIAKGRPSMDRMNGVEQWAERHRLEGHHPHPAPTDENPERWDCDCGGVNRILTVGQTRQKFAHLGAAAKARREGRPLPWDDPARQERIRQAKQRVAEWEGKDGG